MRAQSTSPPLVTSNSSLSRRPGVRVRLKDLFRGYPLPDRSGDAIDTAQSSPPSRSRHREHTDSAMPNASFRQTDFKPTHVDRGFRGVTLFDAECECSICVRALARQLEDAEPFKETTTPLDPCVEQPPSPSTVGPAAPYESCWDDRRSVRKYGLSPSSTHFEESSST